MMHIRFFELEDGERLPKEVLELVAKECSDFGHIYRVKDGQAEDTCVCGKAKVGPKEKDILRQSAE